MRHKLLGKHVNTASLLHCRQSQHFHFLQLSVDPDPPDDRLDPNVTRCEPGEFDGGSYWYWPPAVDRAVRPAVHLDERYTVPHVVHMPVPLRTISGAAEAVLADFRKRLM